MKASHNLKPRGTGFSSSSTTATPRLASTSTSTSKSSNSIRTRTRPHIGGNLGPPATPNFGDPGTVPATSTTSTTPISIPPSTSTSSTVVKINFTTTATPTPTSGSGGDNSNGVNGDSDGPDGPIITIANGSPPLGTSGFVTSIIAPSQATAREGPFSNTQTPQAKGSILTTTQSSNPQTFTVGDFPTTTIPIAISPSQTGDPTIQSVQGPRKTLSPGGIAAIIATVGLLVFVLVFLRRRKKAAQVNQYGAQNTRQFSPSPLRHREFERNSLVIAPHSPPNTGSSSTFSVQRSPTRHIDSDSDTLQLALSHPPMMEIDGRARPVPTLVLNTSRYRRNNHSGPLDSGASTISSISGGSNSRSQAQAQNFHGDTSSNSSRTLSPAEAFASRKAPSTFQDSTSSRSSYYPSLKAPPSPRTPTRGSGVFLPPIPPLPKSPPPIPGIQGANPFVDKNPFDDPEG